VKGVENEIKYFKYSQKVDFVKFIAREARSKPEKKGKFLLDMLVSDLVVQDYKSFISELSDEELEKLDEILGTDHLSRKKELKKKKRRWIRDTAIYAGVLVAIILMGFVSYKLLGITKI
jgi:hypothetical protein